MIRSNRGTRFLTSVPDLSAVITVHDVACCAMRSDAA